MVCAKGGIVSIIERGVEVLIYLSHSEGVSCSTPLPHTIYGGTQNFCLLVGMVLPPIGVLFRLHPTASDLSGTILGK